MSDNAEDYSKGRSVASGLSRRERQVALVVVFAPFLKAPSVDAIVHAANEIDSGSIGHPLHPHAVHIPGREDRQLLKTAWEAVHGLAPEHVAKVPFEVRRDVCRGVFERIRPRHVEDFGSLDPANWGLQELVGDLRKDTPEYATSIGLFALGAAYDLMHEQEKALRETVGKRVPADVVSDAQQAAG